MKQTLRRLCSLLCTLAMVLGMLPMTALAADYSGNLLQNPSFETGSKNNLPGWTLTGGAGQQTNNAHSGSKGFFVDKGTSNAISQTVTAPYSGWYQTSAWISTGGAGSKFGIRLQGSGEILQERELPKQGYEAATVLPPVELKQGDIVEVYVNCSRSSWTNGDDILFGYDFSNVTYNLLAGLDLSSPQTVRLPWAGDYQLHVQVTAESDTTVAVGDDTYNISAGETKALDVPIFDKLVDDTLSLSVTGTCAITDVGLTLDVSSIPNDPPSADTVTVTGLLHSGLSLVGSYAFTDDDLGQGGNEGTSIYRWLASSAANGDYAPIPGATASSLLLTDELAGNYIKFEVTPVDGYGLAGTPVCSEAAGPVMINYVRNPSLDIETSQQPTDWTSKNGGTMPNSKADARNGFRFARIPAADADAEVFYSLTMSATARYTAGVWVKTTGNAGVFGVRLKGAGTVLASVDLTATTGYQFVELRDIVIEENAQIEVFIKGGEGCDQIDADDFQLLYQDLNNLPEFVTLYSFALEGQTLCKINELTHTIAVTLPYDTDVTALTVIARVSDRATLSPASGSVLDFTQPVDFTITNGSTSATWTVSVTVAERMLTLVSDNKTLQDGFNWAAVKTQQFVVTGQSGYINKASDREGTGPVEYMPSYWAGYYDRTAFYSRDFVHQAVGAQIVGLWDENYTMFNTFAKGCTEARKWYTLWAYNFDGSNYLIDYRSDTNFVREVPAQFELVEKAYKQYLWSGDRRYIEDETMWNFYTKVMTDYITLHDTNGNGIAEGTGGGIWSGSCTYNERGGQPIIEAGDAIGSQYQATLAYAAMLKERGEDAASQEWYAKAAELKRYFNEEWSVMPGDDGTGRYARALSTDKSTKYNDFGKENSWFMPMKLITDSGARTEAYLDFIMDEVGDSIGDKTNSPRNIEAWTYLPDTFFPYNRADDAWKYMKYILSVKDKPHERPIQGTNGDYPEISYTFLTHTIEGMMGMEADAFNHKVATAPRLPAEVPNVEVKYIQMGEHVLDITHESLTKSSLANDSTYDLAWEIRFYGEYPGILVDGVYTAAQQKDVNGMTVSYAVVDVPAGGAVTAEATTEEAPEVAYSVTMAPMDHGAVTPDKNAALAGETVTLTVIPETDYMLSPGSLQVNGGAVALASVSDDTYTFAMPAENAAVTATFRPVTTDTDVPVERVTLSVHTLSLYSNAAPGSATLTASVLPADATDRTVVWSSSNPTVATVSQTGIVTAHADGTAIITAAAGGKSDTCAVTVSRYTAPYVPPTDSGSGSTPPAKEEITKNEDGSTTKSVTDKATGSVTATTTYPDGKIVEVVTAKDGGKTIAVTAPDGGTVAELKLPDTVPAPAQPFTDIPDGFWAKSAVDFVTGLGLFNGTGDRQFSGNAPMTRGMLSTVLYRLSGEIPSGSAAFSDVAPGAWYADSIAWAAKNGIVTGVGGNAYAPDADITRESLAVILYRYAGLLGLDTGADGADLGAFSDGGQTSTWAGDAMAWAVKNGILSGKGDGILAPAENATRNEVAVMLRNFIALLK